VFEPGLLASVWPSPEDAVPLDADAPLAPVDPDDGVPLVAPVPLWLTPTAPVPDCDPVPGAVDPSNESPAPLEFCADVCCEPLEHAAHATHVTDVKRAMQIYLLTPNQYGSDGLPSRSP
jgi:hypothetical protein